MPSISVSTPTATYKVHVGSGLLDSLGRRSRTLSSGRSSRLFVITSPEIWKLWSTPFLAAFPAATPPQILFLPAGESCKRMAAVERLAERLARARADRDAVLIAFGGGIVGDITGFLAAIYMRGLDFIQVPTTLLAQVDSSIGGKTGVNLLSGKNLVGSFHHPLAVLADIDLLRTLPDRELRAGMQEVIKASIIRSSRLFSYLEASSTCILDPKHPHHTRALTHLITASVRIKAEVVDADEQEHGLRMILNFGHTLGHAIEAATGYKQLLHGEAIAWGMIAATRLSLRRRLLSQGDAMRIEALIHLFGPLPPFSVTAKKLVSLTGSDKKNALRRPLLHPPNVHRVSHNRERRHFRRAACRRRVDRDRRAAARRRFAAKIASLVRPTPPAIGARPDGTQTEADAAANVQQMFDTIASTYDRANHLLSFGLDRFWWRRAARALRPLLQNQSAHVLDLCCGTGDMTAALLARRSSQAEPILGGDFSSKMLDRARLKHARANARFVEVDALHLPFGESSFDLVTFAFGFRNLANYADGLAEVHRILRPGGEIAILECNQPRGLTGMLYSLYFKRILPLLGGLISGSPAAYRYLPASVERFPRPPRMLQLMKDAGFEHARWTGYTFRTAGLYRGSKS